jgi:hypothetical protein
MKRILIVTSGDRFDMKTFRSLFAMVFEGLAALLEGLGDWPIASAEPVTASIPVNIANATKDDKDPRTELRNVK